MMFKLPNGFLGVFYALAISRADSRATVRNGLYILLANIAALIVAATGIALFVDYPLPRFLFIVSIFFLAFFLTRALASQAVAFGFSLIVVAAASVPIIWARPSSFHPDIETTFWTAFGIMLGTFATVLTEWIFAPRTAAAEEPSNLEPLFVPDAFSNPEYVKFALKGCLAATICYVFWSAVAWPGLGVSTVTCVLAAPCWTPGIFAPAADDASGGVILRRCDLRHRLGGFHSSAGGFYRRVHPAFGGDLRHSRMVRDSSPRLNYFGRQMALAYYITIFQGFGVSATLVSKPRSADGHLTGDPGHVVRIRRPGDRTEANTRGNFLSGVRHRRSGVK